MMDRRGFVAASLAAVVAGCAAPFAQTTARFRSERITVEAVGRGRDVILVPGLGSSPEIWAGLVTALPQFRYHLVHVHGFAGAAPQGNGEGPVIASAAQEIARYVASQRLQQPAIIGHSLGGTIAMAVAARNAGLVSRLMVVDMLPFLGVLFGPSGTTAESVKSLADTLRDRSLAASAEERRATIEATIATMVKVAALRAAPIRHSLMSDREVVARAYHELITTDLRPELPKITVPTTVLYADLPTSPLSEAQIDRVYRTSFSGLPQASLRRVPDSYHFIMYDQPSRFVGEVGAFLRF